MIEGLERRDFLLQKIGTAGSDMCVLSPTKMNEAHRAHDLSRDHFSLHETSHEAAMKQFNDPSQRDE